ncbi:MAG: response regulator [Phycisphaerae bacterium]
MEHTTSTADTNVGTREPQQRSGVVSRVRGAGDANAVGPGAGAADESTSGPGCDGAAARVVVVDDDPAMLRLLERRLVSIGYQVVTATNGAAALRILREHGIQLVITDWDMPDMDGLDLCRAIRSDASLGLVYVVLLTGASEPAGVIEALDAGADDYVTKAAGTPELLARLRAGQRIVRLEAETANRYRIESERNHLQNAVHALERVLGVVGHELRTPLASVRAMAEYLLQEQSRETEECETFLRSIHTEVLKMAATVNDTLDVARMSSGAARWNWSEVCVSDACRSALDTVRPLVDRARVRLTLDVDPPDLTMRGDAGAVRRLVMNLLSNAQKHTQEGVIFVRGAAVRQDGASWVQIQVGDTGEGMPPEITSRLGVAFALNSGAVGEDHVQGNGLGLAICRGIVAAHGGRIVVDTVRHKGTTVTAHLRRDLAEPAPVGGAAEIVCTIPS